MTVSLAVILYANRKVLFESQASPLLQTCLAFGVLKFFARRLGFRARQTSPLRPAHLLHFNALQLNVCLS